MLCKEPSNLFYYYLAGRLSPGETNGWTLIIYDRIEGKFIRDIPITKEGRNKGQPDSFYRTTRLDAQELELDSIESGFETAQIRIWLGHSMAAKHHVVILKLIGKYWHGELVTYEYADENNTQRIKWQAKRKDIYPDSGWKKVIDKLNKLDIMNLPNGDDSTNYNGFGDDGIGYFFEIGTRKRYRFYYYANPDDNSNKFWQAKNVLTFSKLLEDEFNFQYTK